MNISCAIYLATTLPKYALGKNSLWELEWARYSLSSVEDLNTRPPRLRRTQSSKGVMGMILSLSSSNLSDEVIQQLTYDLCADLRRELDEDARVPEELPTNAGIKGDPVTIGTIVLSLVGSGGVAVTLINLLKSYVERGHHLSISIKCKNRTIDVGAENLGPEQIEQTKKLITSILSVS